MLVDLENKTITARYQEVTPFEEDTLLETLVDLNYQWWTHSNDRFDGWKQFDSAWNGLLTNQGYAQDYAR